MKYVEMTVALGRAWLLVAVLVVAGPLAAQAQALCGMVAAGATHSLSIHSDGTLWATGSNGFGQLGTASPASTTAWVQVGAAKDWVQVALGSSHSLGLKADGTLWAWGSNRYGQLGVLLNSGVIGASTAPTQLAGTYTHMSAGAYHSLGLRADGTLWSWGSNEYGQLGTPTNSGLTSPNPTPAQVAGSYVQAVAGFYFSLGLRAGGAAYAWGDNGYGQLGNATNLYTTAANPTPVQVAGVFTQLAAGEHYALGLKADGSLFGWGSNRNGELGMATNSGTNTANPTPVQAPGAYTQVVAGYFHNLGLKADGTLWSWGLNLYGELGTPTNSGVNAANYTPAPVPGTYTQVAAGYAHSFGVRPDGTLYAWGYNQNGQLGNAVNVGTATPNPTPTATGTALPTRSTAAGSNFGLAVRADGTLWAWGDNTYGQLGLGTTGAGTGKTRPTQVGTDRDWVQVAAGAYHSLGLKANGTAYAWGYNIDGELGDNTTTARLVPTPVSGGGAYTQLAAGGNHSLGLRPDGTATAWGYNVFGQLGDGTTTNRLVPTPVSGGGAYTQLAAGGNHSLGLKADGTVYAWGYNVFGQLGDGTTTNRLVPTLVSGGGAYALLATGAYFSLGLRADGTVYAWGDNSNGKLGDGTTTDRRVPTLVSGGGAYTQLATGGYHSLGLRADGTLWSWGDNFYGGLGDGTTTQRLMPTREATLGTGWTLLAPGSTAYFSLARTSSGLAFASTGQNNAGQLGDGTTTQATRFDRLSPLRSFQPLPVELASFTARRTGPATAALAWATASEKNNAGFAVEKSADGVAFAALGFVAGAGSSTVARTYAYADAAAPTAAYYRLAQRDADGTVSYSPVQFVPAAAGEAPGRLALVPNPARDAVQVVGVADGATLVVFDALGRPVRTAPAGALRVAGLPAGLYLVRATAPGQAPGTARLVVE